ncbi:hypothetical protein C8F04DRAFT_968042 [Mycena alexandri]|uniref:Uncharacterized protein n=1 Tax=Mycena alexandri TaxID=1745969 RepID=A0AAD6WUH1_9AGAR|nr:hypothetical protein C8F04DRAFT_968042 [Mycena alexandri]
MDRQELPIGLIWEVIDHSCAFDATFTILFNIWKEYPVKWSDKFRHLRPYYSRGILTLEQARDSVRTSLRGRAPEYFPYGTVGTSIDKLITTMFHVDRTHVVGHRVCRTCEYADNREQHIFNPYICAIPSHSQIDQHPNGIPVSTWLADHLKRLPSRCPRCLLSRVSSRLTIDYEVTSVPCLLVLALDRPGLEYSQTLTFDVDGSLSILKLRGVIYGGDHHFTSRYITPTGDVWFHDGISTGRSCVFEGDLNNLPNGHLTSARGKSAINLI